MSLRRVEQTWLFAAAFVALLAVSAASCRSTSDDDPTPTAGAPTHTERASPSTTPGPGATLAQGQPPPPTPVATPSAVPTLSQPPAATPTASPASLPGPLVAFSQGGTSATVTVEIAATTAQRQLGLMFRQELAGSAGMLFIFPQDVRTGFWMRNTYVPLDIAYIGADGRVQEIRQAKPLDETVLTPSDPYRYVVELNQGWFERHGIGVGARVTLPAGLPAAE